MALINLDPQPSRLNHVLEEKNQVVPPVQGPQRASTTRDRCQRLTQGNYSEQGKKTDVQKIGLHERLQSFSNKHLCMYKMRKAVL